jgi:hypothetical protein
MPCKFKNKKKMAKKYQKGGGVSGPSHKQGGININVEGGEFVINNKAVNSKTKAVLEYINTYGKLPRVFDARKRGKT